MYTHKYTHINITNIYTYITHIHTYTHIKINECKGPNDGERSFSEAKQSLVVKI